MIQVRSCLACLRTVREGEISNTTQAGAKTTAGTNRTSTISSKSSNLDRMADEVILNVSPTSSSHHHQTCASSKLKRKTLEALSRGNAVTDQCYKQREFDAALRQAKMFSLDNEDDNGRRAMLEDHTTRRRKRSLSLGSYFTVLDWDIGAEIAAPDPISSSAQL